MGRGCGIRAACGERASARLPRWSSDQVHQGEDENPDDVDDVPVEAHVLDRGVPHAGVVAALGEEHQEADGDNRCRHRGEPCRSVADAC